MFDIGFWELILISVVGLVVLGPERLPKAIRSVAQFIGAAKSMANNVKDELSQELKIQELQENLRKAEQMNMDDLSPDLKKSVEELKQAAADVTRPYAKPEEEKAETPSADNSSSAASDSTSKTKAE
ncbi:Sec-independent protein translocase protein TatB [Aliivibrio fischeri]|uniref:Sec-independent protein translocase protein TatB n=1 Tax=Aliivibrio fischeri TaxID=668 RepID=UPI0007C54D5E|nr:Sec-independent protein translocase protein TatB [Aliivibrio fischeri]MBP3140546.1 Sec-independent protein translocase subunit TatB [Aliivibrio fischeri]MBP3156136.1 Sec-independent protein translocase subunit TatB [Aliivibrio fischeri]MCE7537351.1 Sec-independent protein translocase protein TatB [Aliivibrio fischeri]MCE7560169.1 Sec-independent protein translocase protein TatB [Aliivibrio fischeri]MCE7574725.1 Sec-independent protein translocase protein TatB [Aliivibrio fischeri]